MNDDITIIKELTNLEIGKIVNDDVKQTYKGNVYNERGCILDERSCNFHLLPADASQFENYSILIQKKRADLSYLCNLPS